MEIEYIVSYYKNHGGSIKQTSKDLGISNSVVKKALITLGEYSCETSILIQSMLEEGFTKEEIIKRLDISSSCYSANTPYEKGCYLTDNKSTNAIRIANCRKKKSATTKVTNNEKSVVNTTRCEDRSLSDKQIKNLLRAGGRRAVFGSNDRIYISTEAIGLKINTRPDGAIQSASICGIDIDVDDAKKLLDAKPWVDVKTGNIFVAQYDGDIKTIQTLIKRIIA